ncbi:MRC1-like domain-containing protein [Pseudoneurospora amorphoporcata]|uniref:MRC1-like domain-containing protein n=1 Tax=Pseudoneurospora amorphoporcata TaxID=241081 RepID=A0AAN6P3G4_9PEZI|nr:MRC1-like domain-containing protein [Pseudoneurospora amorphoporcata]
MAAPASSSPGRASRSRSATPTSPVFNNADQSDVNMSDSSDEVDEEILRPRGRFAAGMLSKSNPAPESESESDEEMRDPPMTKSTLRDDGGGYDDDEEDDEIVTIRPRKLQQRPRKRTATPEPKPRDEPTAASPGLFVSPEKQAAHAPDSPGLFVSPTKRPEDGIASDDEEFPSIGNLQKNPRFQALVEKKRKEREAREAQEERKKAERRAAMAADDDDISDDEGGRKLTQKAATKRPSQRKASKKALEDMNRETQRMARELQLAHEPKVRNKITKATLFERFNFRPAGAAAAQAATTEKPAKEPSGPESPATSRPSDTEKVPAKETPPSSPPVGNKQPDKTVEELATSTGDLLLEENSGGELPTLQEAITQRKKLDKGKGKATAADFEAEDQAKMAASLPKVKHNVRVKFPLQPSSLHANTISLDDDDDDDELQVKPQTRKSKIDAIFDRVPLNQTREPRPLQMLRKLAHIDDPEKLPAAPLPKNKQHLSKHQPPAMTSGALEMTLLQRARAQAKREREEHLEMLRAKGVVVLTAEERAKEMQEVEDIVARARREAEEIMQKERDDAREERRKRKANGEEDPLGWDDSEDDDDESFVGSEKGDDDKEEPEAIELSGSEEEEEEDGGEGGDEEEDEDEDMAEADPAGALFDESAGESGEENAEKQDDEDEDEDELPSTKTVRRRPRKQIVVLSDDDEDEDEQEQVVSSKQRIEETPRPKQRFPKSPASALRSGSPSVPTSVLRSARKNFIPGLPVPIAQPAGLGLTQIFAGTMDDSQPGSPSQFGGSSPSQPRPTFDIDLTDMPDSNFSQTAGQQHPEEEEDMILDSQPSLTRTTRHKDKEEETQAALETQGGVQLGFSQSESQMHGFDSLLLNQNQTRAVFNMTQGSELIEPTQDQGYKDYTPLKQRFVDAAPLPPHSTVETVLVSGGGQRGRYSSASMTASRSPPGGSGSGSVGSVGEMNSPLKQRPLERLRRRGDVITGSALFNASTMDDEEDGDQEMEDAGDVDDGREAEKAKSAFEKMKRAAEREKRLKELKKKSKAREMVEEQAEESEDEYAGLGGIDGEGSSDEEDEELVKEMIDDETKAGEGDERKLAAFYADRERASDEKQVEKLFHDITTGMLRRKRARGKGGEWDDLSDEDDGGEARRRMKRRQFAKMQRALLADERISKVAENPKTKAFLKSIEDRGSDDEMDFLFGPPADKSSSVIPETQESQPSSKDKTIPATQPQTTTSTNPRRTKTGRKPANLGEIRESLSNLLDEPHTSSVIPATVLDEDEEEEDSIPATPGKEPRQDHSYTKPTTITTNPRRTGSVAIVDRISLKRNSSSSSSTTNQSKLAFAAPSSSLSQSAFKVPALLRRATTNSSALSASASASSSTTTGGPSASVSLSTTTNPYTNTKAAAGNAGGFGEDVKIKRTAGKMSGVNYFARENERRAKVAEAEKRREARKWRGVEGRGESVRGVFGKGEFE